MANSGVCSIEKCGKLARTRGWCYGHYRRWLTYGDTSKGGTPNGEPAKFYEMALAFEGKECLIWPFSLDRGGYGRMMRDGRFRIVSRMLCEELNGPQPTPDHEAAHSCGKGKQGCVNPKHTIWKTALDNDKDKDLHGTRCNGEKHPSAKLTASDVTTIRGLVGFMTLMAIADRFGVSVTAIRKIKTGKSWAHI